MSIYVDLATNKIVNEGDSYIGSDGTQYPPSFPKTEISGLIQVIESQPPVDESLVITGFYVDDSNHQVWQTRPMTSEELKDSRVSSLRMQIVELESSVTARRVRDALSADETIAAAGRAWIREVEAEIKQVRVDLASALV